MKNKNLYATLLIIFAVVVIIVSISDSDPVKTTTEENYKIPATFEQSLVEKSDQISSNKLEDLIIEGCLEEAIDQEPYCNCAAKYVTSHVSNASLLSMGLEYEKHGTMSKEIADVMADAVYACIDKYQQ